MSKKEVKLGRKPSTDPKEPVRVWIKRSIIKKLGKPLCQDIAETAIFNSYVKKSENEQ